jgi:hypothetical protein
VHYSTEPAAAGHSTKNISKSNSRHIYPGGHRGIEFKVRRYFEKEVAMQSSVIGKIEKAKKYAQEKEPGHIHQLCGGL